MTLARGVRWLHFSDIHVGVDGQSWLWPRFDYLLLKDLENVYSKIGGFDFLVFSGDLAQKAALPEFDLFDEIVGRILDELSTFGERPKIVTVPGNHDLVRPDKLASEALAMAQFWQNEELRERFWNTHDDRYRQFISGVFANYNEWWNRSIERGTHLAPYKVGLLPGDASYVLRTPAGQIGLACLNSAWLQLGGGDYNGSLQVDTRQLLAITDGRPDDFVERNAVNFLVTHHPPAWLHRDSQSHWNSDINPADRFDLHLFGHMHEPSSWSLAYGGAPALRQVQAASLFGLDTFGDGQNRIQGYSANAIGVEGADRTFISCPRILIETTGGGRKLVPDSTQNINEDTGSFSVSYRLSRKNTSSGISGEAKATSSFGRARLSASPFDLTAIKHHLGDARAHQKVRRVEQRRCIAALTERRAVWLISDWGMGEDGFIAVVRSQLGIPSDQIYRLDLSEYVDRQGYLDGVRTRFGVSFEEIFEAIADNGRSIVIFDDVVATNSACGSASAEADLEDLVGTVSDFAAETYIIIRSQRSPPTVRLPTIRLKALDEADVAIYARESEIGGERYAKPDAVSALYRHTDGVPTRIDAALRDLEIISLSELISSNPDLVESGNKMLAAPPALVATVRELEHSEDRAEQRAYSLLLALSALPQGEQLGRIARFLGPHPFFPCHARALMERALIEAVTLTDAMSSSAAAKALVVPRPVREYIRDSIDEETARSIDNKAIHLFFGNDWVTGNIAKSPAGKWVADPLCNGYEIQNASTLILRTARRALGDVALSSESSIRLASAFIECLFKGDHFRSAASLSSDMIRLLEAAGGFERELNIFKYELARSLRMMRRPLEAKKIFEALDHSCLNKHQRQHAELGLALCLERVGDVVPAAAAAKRAITIDKSSSAALQAKAIIAEQVKDPAAREAQLRRILTLAKRKNAKTTVNNIILTLAREKRKEPHVAAELLKEVIDNSRTKGDFYNGARAIVDLAGLPNADSKNNRDKLIEAYHFLYNERLDDLFNRCHAALWDIFEGEGDTANLLNLFRHSSFIWRLNGREAEETRYLQKLARNVRDLLIEDVRHATRDGAYFLVRVSVVLGELPNAVIEESDSPRVVG